MLLNILLIFFLTIILYNFFTKNIKENFTQDLLRKKEKKRKRNKMSIEERLNEIEKIVNKRYNKLSVIEPNINETKKNIKKVSMYFRDQAKEATGMDENSTIPKASGIND